MGGYGSGRQGGFPTAEATQSFVLRATILKRLPLCEPLKFATRLTFDETGFAIDIEGDTTDHWRPYLLLTHESRRSYDDEESIVYKVYLTSTVPRFGGRRWWFQCPRTSRRVAKLYLPFGGRYFWSRGAYRLGYACQRETARDRLMRKVRKLSYALGGDGDMDWIPPKPKWMRWATYERKAARLEAVAQLVDERFLARAIALLGR